MVTPCYYQTTENYIYRDRYMKGRLLVHNTVEGSPGDDQKIQDSQQSLCPGCDGEHELSKCKRFFEYDNQDQTGSY